MSYFRGNSKDQAISQGNFEQKQNKNKEREREREREAE
jgi:hypothetical protein